MNEDERELLDGLRALELTEPREAPARVEEVLLARFRARRARRRLAVWGSAAAGFAAVAAAVALLWMSPAAPKSAPAATRPGSAAIVEPQAGSAPRVQDAVVRVDDVTSAFYPLPEADALAPLETAMVVRVQMPVSSLRLMGFPAVEDLGAASVEAEVLLGQDGLARGVRLIQ